RSMSTLLGKLAGIVLLIDHFSFHLNSSSIINDTELANKNFHYASEKLYNLWKYSVDIRKCKDFNCCSAWRAKEAAALLAENEGFLPPAPKPLQKQKNYEVIISKDVVKVKALYGYNW
ncbi:29489_t:CDS:2, partial [Gigaspora margarita]